MEKGIALHELIQNLSSSLTIANKKMEEAAKDDMAFAAQDFTITFPAEFTLDTKGNPLVRLVDFSEQLGIKGKVLNPREKSNVVELKTEERTEGIHISSVTLNLKPVPVLRGK